MREIYAVWGIDNNKIYGEYSIDELIAQGDQLPKNRAFLSNYETYGRDDDPKYLRDNNETLIKEFDVLSLDITEKLLNSTFGNSNIGKDLLKHPDVKQVIVTLGERAGLWRLYYADQDGHISRNEDDTPKTEAMAKNTDFICYLVAKGALVTANIKTQPDFITDLLHQADNTSMDDRDI